MNAAGFQYLSAKVAEPSEPVQGGEKLFVVVPFELEMRIPNGKLRQRTFVIGISGDQGKTWTFLNDNGDPKQRHMLVPNLPKALKLPEKSPPVIEKNAPATAPSQ
jgi:hypothetical protein